MRGTEYMGEGGLGGRKKWGEEVTRILWLAFQKNLKEACLKAALVLKIIYLKVLSVYTHDTHKWILLCRIDPYGIRIHMQLSNIMNGMDFQLLSNLKN